MPTPVKRPTKAPAATVQLRVTVKQYPSMNVKDICDFLRSRDMCGEIVQRDLRDVYRSERPVMALCGQLVPVPEDRVAGFMRDVVQLQREQSCLVSVDVR